MQARKRDGCIASCTQHPAVAVCAENLLRNWMCGAQISVGLVHLQEVFDEWERYFPLELQQNTPAAISARLRDQQQQIAQLTRELEHSRRKHGTNVAARWKGTGSAHRLVLFANRGGRAAAAACARSASEYGEGQPGPRSAAPARAAEGVGQPVHCGAGGEAGRAGAAAPGAAAGECEI